MLQIVLLSRHILSEAMVGYIAMCRQTYFRRLAKLFVEMVAFDTK